MLFVGLQELNKLALIGRHSKEADCLCPEDELQLLQAEQKLVSLADSNKAAKFVPVLVQHCELLERKTNRVTALAVAEERHRVLTALKFFDWQMWLAGCRESRELLADVVRDPELLISKRAETALVFSD